VNVDVETDINPVEIVIDVLVKSMTFALIVVNPLQNNRARRQTLRKFVFFFFFISIAFSSFQVFNREKSILARIQQIPIEDRWAIDSFFKILMLQEEGAYVLFGDKPVVFTNYFDFSKEEVFSNFRRKSWLVNKQIRQGWQTWQKYVHLFPSHSFLLKGKRSRDDRTEIMFIDKKRFQGKFEEHLDDFQSILGKEMTASGLLSRYENTNQPFFDLLDHHSALLGILLGYGRENSWLFYLRDKIYENDGETYDHFTLTMHPRPFSYFNSVTEEREYYRNTLVGIFQEKNYRKPYKFLYLPMFLVNLGSQETKQLQEKYLRQRECIHETYRHGDFLEITLRRFCS
jgi:hypothetical protein